METIYEQSMENQESDLINRYSATCGNQRSFNVPSAIMAKIPESIQNRTTI